MKAKKPQKVKKLPATNLSPRRRKLLKNVLSGEYKTKKDVILSAGYTEGTATKSAELILGNLRFKSAMVQAMEAKGIDDARLAEKLDEGLEANKVISAMVVAPNGEGMADASGVTKDFIEVPDYLARHKYLETALELRGDFPNKKVDVDLTVESHEQRIARLRGEEEEEEEG
jgi:hypothetical protein